jgi:hypothetical protein
MELPMRVLFIAAVLGILVQPAFAFNEQICFKLESSAITHTENSEEFKRIAKGEIPNGFTKATDQERENYDQWQSWADQQIMTASHYATIYQAFCKN